MLDKKDYTQLTLPALLIEEKKARKNKALSAGLIGFLIGVMVYGLATKGFGFFYLALPIVLIVIIYKNTQVQDQNLKQIQTEINNKNAS